MTEITITARNPDEARAGIELLARYIELNGGQPTTTQDLDAVGLGHLELTHRAEKLLTLAGITTVGQLIVLDNDDLLSISGVGRTTIMDIDDALAKHRLLRPR